MTFDPDQPLDVMFEDLFRTHYRDLRRYAIAVLRKRTGNADADRAEEAVQETFAVAWNKADALLASPSPVGWLYKTLFHVLRNMLREDHRWTMRLLKLQESAQLQTHHPAPGADLELEGFVSPEELELLKRLYVNGESYQDLCRDLGITRSALAKRIQRIKEKFRKNYAADRELSGSGGHVSNRGGSKQ